MQKEISNDLYVGTERKMMKKEEIKKILPHREPLLLVDRVTELQLPDRIEAEVDIQKDWQIFQGHFPEQPVLPGVYIMESMAQTADILLLLSEQNRGKLPLFFQVSQMRFYHPVYPGERLYLSAQLVSDAGNGMYDCRVTAKTDAVRQRSFVFLLCENTPGAVIGYLGCLNAGAVPLLLNAELDETLLQEMYERYQPEYVWMPKKHAEAWKPCCLSEKQNKTDENINKNDEKNCTIGYEEAEYVLYQTGASKGELHPKLALLLATSGSTGSPKLVRFSLKNLESNAVSIMEYLKLTESERAITCLPMQYTYGLSVMNSHFQAGACVLLTTGSVVQQQFWDYFKSEEGTSLVGVPYTYELFRRLHLFDDRVQKPGEQPWYQHLRYMTQAGGRLPEPLQQKIGTWAKEHGIEFVVMYGQTEATARMSYLPADQCLEKIGSIGSVDRIVDIGHALDFSLIWDGMDFMEYLTRKINIS